MRFVFHLVILMGCAALLVAPSGAQDKSGENQPAASATNDSPKPSTAPDIRTLSGDRVYRVADGLKPPRVIDSPDPKYPKSAKNYEGTVVLWLIVNSQGLPEQMKVQKSFGHGLDESAIAAVSQWKFAPATKDGVPVPVMINVEVNFRLH